MSTKSVLQYVQACLSQMDSDEVDSIGETTESLQVATLLSDLYYELVNQQEWGFLHLPVQVVAAVDVTKPTKFTIPTNVRRLLHLWYNIHETPGIVNRRELRYAEPDEFLRISGGDGSMKQLVTDGSQLQFYVYNDRMPSIFTSFDGNTIYCDAFKATVDSTLVQAKVSALGIVNPAFEVNDTFVPLLPEHMVPLMQHTLNGSASLLFKQQASPVDEKRVARQQAQMMRRESKLTRSRYYNNTFGRR